MSVSSKRTGPAQLSKSEIRVAIIGAGAAGLACAREFLSAGYATHVYEATPFVGGTWRYSSLPGTASSMYASLRCNIPSQIMAFSDMPFPPNTPSFAGHDVVQSYLEKFAARHDILRHVRFRMSVSTIFKHDELWHVVTDRDSRESYDAVLVCVGHFTVPSPWKVPDMHYLSANGVVVQHSHIYKQPAPYVNRDVLVIGAGPSGIDISLELSRNARTVFFSHKRDTPVFLRERPSNLREVGPVWSVLPDGRLQMADGTAIRVDDIVVCNGYQQSYPFLEPSYAGLQLASHGKAMYGLVMHTVVENDPTLALIGLTEQVIPFPLFEDQAAFVRAVLEGRVSKEKLMELVGLEKPYKPIHDSKLHLLGMRQWEYRRILADLTGRKPPAPAAIEIAADSSIARKTDPVNYRKREYKLLGDNPGMWRVFVDGEDATGDLDPSRQ